MASSPAEYDPDLLETCERFLESQYKEDVLKLAKGYPKDGTSIEIDHSDIFRWDMNLADDFIEYPEYVRGHFNKALREMDLPIDISFDQAEVRVGGLIDEHIYDVGEYHPDEIDQFLGVRGQVTQATERVPRLEDGVFECQRCGMDNLIPQAGEDIQEPYECTGCERKGPFKLSQEKSRFSAVRRVRIQLPPEKARGTGEQHVDAVLSGDIADPDLIKGNERIEITGRLAINEDATDTRNFDFHLEGDSVDVEEGRFDQIDISEHQETIDRILESDDPIELLKDSVAPNLSRGEDLDIIIEAAVLQLAGAGRKDVQNGPTNRGDWHMLLLGDPGTAKSEVLHAVTDLSPISKFASGKSVTKAGLTAAAVKDDFGGDNFTLKAGLLVLANDGVACIDEIDKMDNDVLQSAHSALENQHISVQKAGIDADLPAQTRLLAAGNPKYGRFDEYEPIGEQLEMPPSMLSRFDLMFMLSDKPDAERDKEIADHVTETWDKSAKAVYRDDESGKDVIEREIPADAFRAYISYVRNNIYPTFDDESVRQRIIERYVDLRTQNSDDDDSPVPLTARKLEALLRLAESSARARGSEEITHNDVDRAFKLVEKSLEDVGMDPDTGKYDADIVETGQPKAQRDRIKRTKAIIRDLEEEFKNGAPIDEVIVMLEEMGTEKSKAEHTIEKLKSRGEAYEPTDNHLRLS